MDPLLSDFQFKGMRLADSNNKTHALGLRLECLSLVRIILHSMA